MSDPNEAPEGPPKRPLPPESCPSPLDRIEPLAHGLAMELATEKARELMGRMRMTESSVPSLFRLTQEKLPEAVDEIASWTLEERKATVDEWWRRRKDEQQKRVLEGGKKWKATTEGGP